MSIFNEIIAILALYGRTLARIFRRPWRFEETLQCVVQIGIQSIPIIALATMFSGILVSVEIAWHMDQALHSVEMIPGVTGQFVLRELGVVIPALLLAAKAGAATTAEMGSMKVTEQIEALQLLGIDPIAYLVVPRFLGSIISMVCLTLIAITVTLLGAVLVAVNVYHFNFLEYVNTLSHFIEPLDITHAILKAVAFGSIIPIIACSFGFRCKGGAEGVGSATTNAVVATTIALILMDFVLTSFFLGAL